MAVNDVDVAGQMWRRPFVACTLWLADSRVASPGPHHGISPLFSCKPIDQSQARDACLLGRGVYRQLLS